MHPSAEWCDPGDIELKSTPQQSRSRETLDRLLAAADVEFARHGLAAATTTAIAERAGVSVGALYRFFGDKRAIADALAQRYLADASASFGVLLDGDDDLAATVRGLVRCAADLQCGHAGYYRLAQDLRPDGDDSPGHVVRTTLVDTFVDRLGRLGLGTTAETRVVIELIVETVRHTLVVHPPSSPGRDAALAELETMVAAYATSRLGSS
ncbi:MAG: TetR/AcrR family transcriptional regulator [Ilumatobacter sp.]|nr:TetR/AcrR family transcriptional regulator [Ilumatobacter sp.]